jgi:hypothetical protein
MRTLLLLLVAGLSTAGSELATDYGRVRTLRTTSELELDLETTRMEMKVDDEPAERPEGGGMSSSLVRRSTVADEILEGAGGTPKRLRRRFERLADENTSTFGEGERSDERDYPLQGVTLELALDEEGEVHSELVTGQRPDDAALLEGHALAQPLDAFLPDGAVELEASWELDDAAVKRALAMALDAKLFAEPPLEERGRGERGEGRGPRGRGPGGGARSLGRIEWEGKATLVALDAERDGVKCARIALELDGEGTIPEPSFRGPPGGFMVANECFAAPAREGRVEAELEGEFFFALEERRAVALKLDGELRTENSFEREREGRRFSMHSEQAGRLTLTITVEEAR